MPPAIKLDLPLPTEGALRDAIFVDPLTGAAIVNVFFESFDASYASRLNAFLTFLTGNYHYIIAELPDIMDGAIFSTLNQSDTIHLITNYETNNLKKARVLLSDLFEKIKYPQEKIRVILNRQEEKEKILSEEAAQLLNYNVYATLPSLDKQYREAQGLARRVVWEYPELEYSRSIRRIARELGNIRVGLALGAGAAFGLAHIGVLKVLERENIPIDAIAGTSMGAVIAALWAAGISAKEIERIFLEYNNNRKKTYGLLLDLYVHKMSIAKGNKIRRVLSSYIGGKTFQDVKIPLRIVAYNITKRREVVYSSGALIDAIMPSIAIPGVFAPAVFDGDLIIDGGIIEPVPIGTLVRQGIKKIIAVNVLPSPENAVHNYKFMQRRKAQKKEAALAGGFRSRLRYYLYDRFMNMFSPNILDIIVNSVQTMEYAIAESDSQKADILLSPIAEGVDWFDFFRVETLIKRGEEEANKMLSAIKGVLGE
jgi:NTE family protein